MCLYQSWRARLQQWDMWTDKGEQSFELFTRRPAHYWNGRKPAYTLDPTYQMMHIIMDWISRMVRDPGWIVPEWESHCITQVFRLLSLNVFTSRSKTHISLTRWGLRSSSERCCFSWPLEPLSMCSFPKQSITKKITAEPSLSNNCASLHLVTWFLDLIQMQITPLVMQPQIRPPSNCAKNLPTKALICCLQA